MTKIRLIDEEGEQLYYREIILDFSSREQYKLLLAHAPLEVALQIKDFTVEEVEVNWPLGEPLHGYVLKSIHGDTLFHTMHEGVLSSEYGGDMLAFMYDKGLDDEWYVELIPNLAEYGIDNFTKSEEEIRQSTEVITKRVAELIEPLVRYLNTEAPPHAFVTAKAEGFELGFLISEGIVKESPDNMLKKMKKFFDDLENSQRKFDEDD